jgi:hypothetical protein
LEVATLAIERRFVAISSRHPLADRQSIEFSGDRRPAVRDFVQACREAADPQKAETAEDTHAG